MARWTRFWSAWWIARCSTRRSYARSPTRLRKPRRRRGEGRNNVGDSGGVRVSLPGPRKRRVGRLASSSRAKSARAYDVVGRGAGGIVDDAAIDALDHRDRAPAAVGDSDAGKPMAGG